MSVKELPPAYVQWATALANRPTYECLTPPTEEEEGGIYASMYRERVMGDKPKPRTLQKRKTQRA